MSRVCMIACGVIMLSAVLLPVTQTYDSMEDSNLTDAVDGVADMLDGFWESELDVMYIRGWEILPDSECGLILDGNHITLYKNGKEYCSLISHPSEHMELGYNDILTIQRSGETMIVFNDHRIDQTPF